MAVSDSRIVVESVIKNNAEGGSYTAVKSTNTDTSSSSTSSAKSMVNNAKDTLKSVAKDIEPEGAISLLPTSLVSFSSFKELSYWVSGNINKLKNSINSALKIPDINDLLRMTGRHGNLNNYFVNKGLSLFKSVFCGDGRGINFGLYAILQALDYRFDFLYGYNVCGRQQLRNPIDVLLKSKKQFEDFSYGIANIDKKLLNNLLRAANQFVENNGLPIELKNCTSYKTAKAFAKDYRNGISLGILNKLKTLNANKMCSSSDKGFTPNSKYLNKVSSNPFIKGLVKYDEDTMYSAMTGILNNSNLDRDSILDNLHNAILDSNNSKDTTKALGAIALTKVVGAKNKNKNIVTTVTKGENIKDINNKLQGQGSNILDKVLDAHKNNTNINSVNDLVNGSKLNTEETDMLLAGKMDAKAILCNMKDELSDVDDPEKEFYKICSLLEIADPSFKAKDNIDYLNLSPTMNKLADRVIKGRMYKNNIEPITIGTDTYYKVNKQYDIIDSLYVLNNVKAESNDILRCKCVKC